MSDQLKGNTDRPVYSGKITAFKYIGGSINGLISSAIAIVLLKFFPDMTDSDKNYMMLVVIPTICGIPPAMGHWVTENKFGRALLWWLNKKYNNMIKSIFKGVPDEILEEEKSSCSDQTGIPSEARGE